MPPNFGNLPSAFRSALLGFSVSVQTSRKSSSSKVVVQWREATAALRGSPEDAVLLSLFHDRRDVEFVEQAGFDGAYSYFASEGFTEGSTSAGWARARRDLAAAGKLFVPAVGPGYDDTRIRPWNAPNTRDRERGQYYARLWQQALAAQPHAISITSYNEWGEGLCRK